MVLILDGACDDGRVGRAVERMWKRRFYHPQSLGHYRYNMIITHNLVTLSVICYFYRAAWGSCPSVPEHMRYLNNNEL